MINEHYDPRDVETRAREYWSARGSFRVSEDPARPKYYCLSMFPYPSGKLHMGHVRNYSIGDAVSRYRRMQGYNVLQPMGWDAFGLPAENAAIQNRVPPARWTDDNIAHMRGQLHRLGFAYDWDREFATCKPDYFRWEQWFFTRLFRKGLAYRRNATVNWDPVDRTVLANEQVIDGRGWRSGAVVERREIPQWFLRITAYADELLEHLDRLDGWPEAVRTMQRNWIGRSRGMEVDFPRVGGSERLRVFTTRPDTIAGVTFMAVAAEHPWVAEVAAARPEVARFVEECRRGGTTEAEMETLEKKGLPLGVEVENPITGERVEVWVANFVLMGYGTGAVMGVPGHDQRDWEFASAHGLPIPAVIRPADGDVPDLSAGAFVDRGVLCNSGALDGLDYDQAFDAIAARLGEQGLGNPSVQYRLRDWLVSRQRYWGCPIPIVHCPRCGPVAVPDEDLPVVFPPVAELEEGLDQARLSEDFVRTHCPECGGPAERETDTFDTFVESSWYFARFASADNDGAMVDERANYWLPVDQYIGGIEHAILHLLYARFFHKLMRDEGLVGSDEPFERLLTQGMVLNHIYYRRTDHGGIVYFNPADIEITADDSGQPAGAVLRADGLPVETAGMGTMSKSKNNGVDPQSLVDRFGADTVRLFTLFAAPPEHTLEWNDHAVAGADRYLRRLWRLAAAHQERIRAWNAGDGGQPDTGGGPDRSVADLRNQVHTALERISRDMERFQFNTVIAACMEIGNGLDRASLPPAEAPGGAAATALLAESLGIVIRVLAPIVPHLGHELWRGLGYPGDVIDAPWPQPDPAALLREEVELAVQVNGKLRGQIRVPADAAEAVLRQAALADERVHRHVGDRPVRKFVVVPGRLVNVVVG